MNKERIVILGNGGAAIHAAQAARQAGHQGEIHLVSNTNGPAFNPMLSPYYLKGIIPWERCFPYGAAFYREYELTCHFESPVESLDAVNREMALPGGRKLAYDQCVIATGADPVIPPVPGLRESPHAFPLRNAESAKKLEQAIHQTKRAVVLGASLVGLKVAEIITKKNGHVILLDVVDQVLPRGAHPETAAILKTYFENKGMDVRLGCSLQGMESADGGVTCYFPESIIEQADFVAVCTGVRPSLGFVDPAQVEIDLAILVDDGMRTSARGLYAAGDVCQGPNPQSGRREWLGTWGSACYQGRTAGCNMAGKPTRFPGLISLNISPFFEWTYAQLGDVNRAGGDVRTFSFGDPLKDGFFLLVFEGNLLVGANLINCTHLAGKLQRAMTQHRDWRHYLADPQRFFTASGLEKILNEIADRLVPIFGG